MAAAATAGAVFSVASESYQWCMQGSAKTICADKPFSEARRSANLPVAARGNQASFGEAPADPRKATTGKAGNPAKASRVSILRQNNFGQIAAKRANYV